MSKTTKTIIALFCGSVAHIILAIISESAFQSALGVIEFFGFGIALCVSLMFEINRTYKQIEKLIERGGSLPDTTLLNLSTQNAINTMNTIVATNTFS